jgi:hypothetical protein
MSLDTPSAAEIAKHYTAALDSVNLINELVAKDSLDAEELDTVDRNVRHLEIMLGKDYWTDENLTPFSEAVDAGKAALN